MIASILMVIEMTIGVLVEALLPGGTAGGAVDGVVHKPPSKDER